MVRGLDAHRPAPWSLSPKVNRIQLGRPSLPVFLENSNLCCATPGATWNLSSSRLGCTETCQACPVVSADRCPGPEGARWRAGPDVQHVHGQECGLCQGRGTGAAARVDKLQRFYVVSMAIETMAQVRRAKMAEYAQAVRAALGTGDGERPKQLLWGMRRCPDCGEDLDPGAVRHASAQSGQG